MLIIENRDLAHAQTFCTRVKVTALSADIDGMDALSQNYQLSKFVTEVAKKSGGKYSPKTVYGIICTLKRYLEEKNGSEALNPLALVRKGN